MDKDEQLLEKLKEFYLQLEDQQTDLDPEMAEALYDNLWELYDSDDEEKEIDDE